MANYDRDKMEKSKNSAFTLLGTLVLGTIALVGGAAKNQKDQQKTLNANNSRAEKRAQIQNQLNQVRSELSSVRYELNHYRSNIFKEAWYSSEIEALNRRKASLEEQERKLMQQINQL